VIFLSQVKEQFEKMSLSSHVSSSRRGGAVVRTDLCEQKLKKLLRERNEISNVKGEINLFKKTLSMSYSKKASHKKMTGPPIIINTEQQQQQQQVKSTISSKKKKRTKSCNNNSNSSSLSSRRSRSLAETAVATHAKNDMPLRISSISTTKSKKSSHISSSTSPSKMGGGGGGGCDSNHSLFPRRYSRGELPCTIRHCANGLALSWSIPLEELDYYHFLPIFMDGVRCTRNPYKFIARQGVYEMIQADSEETIIPTILPSLIKPMRFAFLTKKSDTVLALIRIIKHMVSANHNRKKKSLAIHLTPHLRQVLSPVVLNYYLDRGGKNTGDAIDYSQYRKADLSVEIWEMLEMLEMYGGEGVYETIKLMVPTYQSICYP